MKAQRLFLAIILVLALLGALSGLAQVALAAPSTTLVISEVLYNPTGDEAAGEWVELYVASSPGNLSSWQLTDQDVATPYTFPIFTPAAGEYIVVHTGSGINDLTGPVYHLYWGRDSGVWNNDGDDVLLTDGTNPVDYIAYDSGSAIDPPPSGLSWSGPNPSSNTEGTSISLKNNGVDGDSGDGWEKSGTAATIGPTSVGSSNNPPYDPSLELTLDSRLPDNVTDVYLRIFNHLNETNDASLVINVPSGFQIGEPAEVSAGTIVGTGYSEQDPSHTLEVKTTGTQNTWEVYSSIYGPAFPIGQIVIVPDTSLTYTFLANAANGMLLNNYEITWNITFFGQIAEGNLGRTPSAEGTYTFNYTFTSEINQVKDGSVDVTIERPDEVWVDDNYTGNDNDGGHDWNYDAFAHVQDGVNAVNPGGTVHVYPGTYDSRYFECPWAPTCSCSDNYAPALIVYKDGLTIQAEDPDPANTVIQSTHICWSNAIAVENSTNGGVTGINGWAPNAAVIIANDVTIKGFTFHRPYNCSPNIYDCFYNTAGVMIGTHGAGYNTFVSNADGATVRNNVFSDVWHAVYIWRSSDNLVQDNAVQALGADTTHWAAISVYDGGAAVPPPTSQNNIIRGNILADKGIAVGAWPGSTDNSGTEIVDNTATSIGLTYNNSNDIVISSNTLSSPGGNGLWTYATVLTNTQITSNTVTNSARGMRLEGLVNSTVSYNTVSGSTGPTGYGIGLRDNSNNTAVSHNAVTGNEFGLYLSDNGANGNNQFLYNLATENITGTQVIAGASSDVFHNNCIARNTNYGAENTTGNLLDAEINWWGSPFGPTHSSNPGGNGDAVSDDIDFDPWLTAPPDIPGCPADEGAIHVQKYKDLDGDGEKDDDEPGLNGWTITLYDDQNNVVLTDTTHTVDSEDGWVWFEYLPTGTYTVCETLPGGWANSDPGTDSPCKTVSINNNQQTILFGNYELVPDIAIAKTPDTQTVFSGSDATFTITVTNTGNVTLDDVTVTDILASDCDANLGSLDPEENRSYTCTLANVTADFTNSVIVTGTPPVGDVVSDTDTASVTVRPPGPCIDIEKTGPKTAHVGDTITYHFVLTNCGTTPLKGGAHVYDPLFGSGSIWDGDMYPWPDKSSVITFTRDYTVQASDFPTLTNTARAIGRPPGMAEVSDEDTWEVSISWPSCASTVYVDDAYCDGCANDGHYWSYNAFNTIQDGVDAVCDGGTVHVAAGTYNENVVLPASTNLTLLGAQHDVDPGCDGGRGDESILDGGGYSSGNYGIKFPTSPGTIVINGFTIKNYEYGIWGRASGTYVIGATISYNILENNGDPALPGGGANDSQWHHDGGALRIRNMDDSTISYNLVRNGERGIRLEPDGADTSDGNTIAHNCAHDNQQYGIAIYDGGDNNTIEYNTVYNNADRGIQLTYTSSTGNKINHNIVYNNCNDGILLQGGSSAEIKDNTVYNNAFTDETWSGDNPDNGGPNSGFGYQPVHGGITVSFGGAAGSNITISGNDVYDNGTLPTGQWPAWNGSRSNTDADGVYVGSAAVATVNCNNIHGNPHYGVENLNTGNMLDAEDNWWGDASGPTHAGNPGGTGDAVSDYVDYDPWSEFTPPCGPHPCIALEKTGPATAHVGETITYHFVVTDCGNTPLYGGAHVYDPLLSTRAIWSGHMEPGDVVAFDKTYTVKSTDPDPLVNTATAVGHPPGAPSVTDKASWTVDIIPTTGLNLTLDPETITAGESVTCTATASDDYGNTWDVIDQTVFSIETGAGGSWADNVYTSQKASIWTVTAEYDGQSDTANLTVEHAAAASIEVTLDSETVTAGDSVTYTGTAEDVYGNTWDVTDDTDFTIEAAAEGTWDGNTYTAAKAGQWTVTAGYAGHEAQLTLTVEPNVPAHLAPSAEPTTLPADGKSTAVITAIVTDDWDNLVADDTSVTFSTTAGTLSTDTAPTKDGLATATLTSDPISGNALVTVTVNGIEEIIEVGFEVTGSENRIYLPLIWRE